MDTNCININGLGKCLDEMQKISGIAELKYEEYSFQYDGKGRLILKVNGAETDYYIDQQGYLINDSMGELTILEWIHSHGIPESLSLAIALKNGIQLCSGKLNPNILANHILKIHKIICCSDEFYIYKNGAYILIEPIYIERFIKHYLGNNFSIYKSQETVHSLKTACNVDLSQMNGSGYINLKNGMYDLETGELKKHSPLYYSTIQHDFIYDPSATCSLWHKTLGEVFENDNERISLLQEYMGLCLTKKTKYEKALFCYGDGANGKSVVLHVLVKLIGEVNCSTIPLEKFDDLVCRGQMENKLVNVSVETKSKLRLSDSSFKAITSGEPVPVNPKYKPPRSMYPFCKPVFASNNLFFTTDHTDAVFRRIIILPFKCKFNDSTANRDLKYQLEKELPGIFLWAIEGLRRLEQRGYFKIPASIQAELEEFRKDNMPILQFVEERCELDRTAKTTIDVLYEDYKHWCRNCNHKETSKRSFIRELKNVYGNQIEKRKVRSQRGLSGITICPDKNYDWKSQLRERDKILEESY